VTDAPVGLYDDDAFDAHDAGPGHPERPQRLEAIRRGLQAGGLVERCLAMPVVEASHQQLGRVHTSQHIERVAQTRGQSVRLDVDTHAGPRSCEAALKAAGAVVDGARRVLSGELSRALCLVRPPGHHAEADRAMGFCLFNNVAVAAADALATGTERVMIIDFDVHHGNGTQHIFERDPRVLYLSSHAWPFYPGTGALEEMGEGEGRGFTVNLPLPSGMGDAEYARVYRDIVLPIGESFDPELLIVSAGFDAFGGDPLAGMRLTRDGYAELTEICLRIAAGASGGRAVFALEGGYDLDGLAACSAALVQRLLGEGATCPEPLFSQTARDLVTEYRRALREYWPVLA
jgi:acetoin utilization deacetylase AcuC-like enzyme